MTDNCLEDGYVEKQPVALTEQCAKHSYKKLKENKGTCTVRRDIQTKENKQTTMVCAL